MKDQILKLKDGRQLSFASYGKLSGKAIFYFTGGNSSRLEGKWFEKAAREQNIRLIVPDRPGFGLSDFQPERSFLDWAKDIEELADALKIENFAIFGLSGGSPHVAAVCYLLPERITRAAIISGVAPPEMPNKFKGMWLPVQMIFFFARYAPSVNRFLLKQMSSFYADKEKMLKQMMRAMPKPDQHLINNRPEIIDIFSEAASEAHRNGLDGDHWEWQMYVRPWGFALNDIKVKIGLWYGEVDGNVPVGMGQYLAKHIPNSLLKIVPDGGHFSTINNHIHEIFDFLLA